MFDYTFQWRQAFRALPQMLEGALVTLQIAILSMLIGVVIAVFLAVARNSPSRLAACARDAWVEVARTRPPCFQIYMAHFGLGSFGIYLSPFTALLAGIAFNNAGYLRRPSVARSGLSLRRRPARALARHGAAQAFRLIVMPQMFRISSCRRPTRWFGPS
jgi:polar amino acid transport system permease protein